MVGKYICRFYIAECTWQKCNKHVSISQKSRVYEKTVKTAFLARFFLSAIVFSSSDFFTLTIITFKKDKNNQEPQKNISTKGILQDWKKGIKKEKKSELQRERCVKKEKWKQNYKKEDTSKETKCANQSVLTIFIICLVFWPMLSCLLNFFHVFDNCWHILQFSMHT